MTPARRHLLSLGIGVAVAVALVVVLVVTSSPEPTRAAAFRLPGLTGGQVTVPVVRDGHDVPVVLAFFASWCGPCRGELPTVAAVARSEAGSGVQFIGVDCDDTASSGLAFARSAGVTFPVAQDPDVEVPPRYGLTGYPDTVFIDAQGDVAHVVQGPVSGATLRAWVARVEAKT